MQTQRIRWRRKGLVFYLVCAFMGWALLGAYPARGAEITVGAGESIQAALDEAEVGDTILVKPGTYTENLDISKSVVLRSEAGFENTAIQAANPDKHAIYIRATKVTVEGFSVYGATEWGRVGIFLSEGSSFCTIRKNRCGFDGEHRNFYGISIIGSANHNISENIAGFNEYGIYLSFAENNSIFSNNFSDNIASNIALDRSQANVISENTCRQGGQFFGISLEGSSDNRISGNICSQCYAGMALYESQRNIIWNNEMRDNGSGVYLWSSMNNEFYLNELSNPVNIQSEDSENKWYSPKMSYEYEQELYEDRQLGNFYQDHQALDSDGDGIADTPKDISDETAQDLYPLVQTLDHYKVILNEGRSFDGDAKVDMLWQNRESGQVSIWLMNGKDVEQKSEVQAEAIQWAVAASADFDGDGNTDILWMHEESREVKVWLMDGTEKKSEAAVGTAEPGWDLIGAVDLNGTDRADLLWQDRENGAIHAWLMNGSEISEQGNVHKVDDLEWIIKGLADFNGDNKTDILWRHIGTGNVYIWLMNGIQIMEHASAHVVDDADWRIKATADFNADGKADVLWRNSRTGNVYVWLMDGKTIAEHGCAYMVEDMNWEMQRVADFDGNGTADVLWRHLATGNVYMWLMDGITIADHGSAYVLEDMNWQVQDVADFDGDGKKDMLWLNHQTGDVYVWLMNGKTLQAHGSAGLIDPAWRIQ